MIPIRVPSGLPNGDWRTEAVVPPLAYTQTSDSLAHTSLGHNFLSDIMEKREQRVVRAVSC